MHVVAVACWLVCDTRVGNVSGLTPSPERSTASTTANPESCYPTPFFPSFSHPASPEIEAPRGHDPEDCAARRDPSTSPSQGRLADGPLCTVVGVGCCLMPQNLVVLFAVVLLLLVKKPQTNKFFGCFCCCLLDKWWLGWR